MATIQQQPSVYLVIEGSMLAFDESGEIVETVERNEDGTPNWAEGTYADHRGIGGANGYAELVTALNAAEGNAALVLEPNPVVRVVTEV